MAEAYVVAVPMAWAGGGEFEPEVLREFVTADVDALPVEAAALTPGRCGRVGRPARQGVL